MSGFINAVSLQNAENTQVNFSQGVMPVKIMNLSDLAPPVITQFYGSGVLSIPITNNGTTGTLIKNVTITTKETGYISAHCYANFMNSGNTDYLISFYVVLDGITSNPTNQIITKKLSTVSSYVSSSLAQRTTDMVTPGTYNINVYAYTNDNPSGSVTCAHLDVMVYAQLQ